MSMGVIFQTIFAEVPTMNWNNISESTYRNQKIARIFFPQYPNVPVLIQFNSSFTNFGRCHHPVDPWDPMTAKSTLLCSSNLSLELENWSRWSCLDSLVNNKCWKIPMSPDGKVFGTYFDNQSGGKLPLCPCGFHCFPITSLVMGISSSPTNTRVGIWGLFWEPMGET